MPQTLREIYDTRVRSGDLQPDAGQLAAIDALERLRHDLASPKPKKGWFSFLSPAPQAPKGLYLYGDVGRGKTMLMDLFSESLPEDIAWQRLHFHQFMLSVDDYLHKARQEDGQSAAFLNYAKHIAKDIRLLCFDEFHVTDIADAMILGRLFEALLARGVTIIATSNWPPERLYEGGLQRDRFLPFIDLIKERMQVVAVTGEHDYRLQCLTDTGVYFTPLGKAAARQEAVQLTRQRLAGMEEFMEVTNKIFQQFIGINAVLYYAPLMFQNMGQEIRKKCHVVCKDHINCGCAGPWLKQIHQRLIRRYL